LLSKSGNRGIRKQQTWLRTYTFQENSEDLESIL
jgi:hypothetical protein